MPTKPISMELRLSSLSSAVVRRRLPLVGAICMLGLGVSSLVLPYSVASSPSFVPLISSRFSARTLSRGAHTVRMEANQTIVPSIVVYVTVPNKEAGVKLANSIVKERLAACVNRVPGVESIYEWNDTYRLEELLIIKTRESLLGPLTEHVKANHEYEVPEVISLPITGGNLEYLEWIKKSTRD